RRAGARCSRRRRRSSTRPGGSSSSPASRCCSPSSRSTCSATECATPSTREQPDTQGGFMMKRRIHGRKTRWPALTAAAALAVGLVAAGCGGGGSNNSAGQTTGGAVTPQKAEQGGTISVLSAGDVDYIDPGQTYYSFGYQVAYATQRPLLSYKPNS